VNLLTAPLLRETTRSADAIVADVVRRLGSGPKGTDQLRDAVVRIFGRYCEMLIERLNRVPETHHLAFLDMLGAEPVSAVAAQVPLSFKAVEWGGKIEEAPIVVVPACTQVAAPPASGDAEPVVFETLSDLKLVRAALMRAVAADMCQQLVADAAGILSTAGLAATTMFAAAQPMERAVHFAQSAILGLGNLSELRLIVDIEGVGTSAVTAAVEWGMSTPHGFVALTPELDTTNGLRCSGEVVFRNLPQWPTQSIHSTASKWLTGRLRPGAAIGTAGERPSARINRLRFAGSYGAKQTPVEGACWGIVPLDVTRELFPLGERPRFGEVFHIRSQAFATAGASVTVHVKLVNPAGAVDSPIPAVSRAGKPRLQWEVHTSQGWSDAGVADGTRSLTQDGDLRFTVPTDAAPVAVAGVEGGWLRARLIYGAYAERPQEGAVSPVVPLTPPAIASLAVSRFASAGPAEAEHIVIEGGLEYTAIDMDAAQPFDPFPASETQGVAIYLGIKAEHPKELARRTLSIHASPADRPGPVFWRDDPGGLRSECRWQVRGSAGWHECRVDDRTQGMRHPEIVSVHLPDDVGKWPGSTLDPDQALFWLRILWDAPWSGALPSLRRLVLNTVPAIQAIRLENELLGSSNGRPSQLFHTARAPVIDEVTLEVREFGALPSSEANAARDVADTQQQTWVRWSRVADFQASDMRARHFTLDPLAGAVRFGDGAHGRIPPAGPNNIRLRSYRTGGGKRGNRPAQAITQLRTTVPYVESVTNCEPSAGGLDTEDSSSMRRSAAAWLRHRQRAVCADDYADLAREASPEVASAMCVAARDLVPDPLSRVASPGVVSVVVVPRSAESRPQPSFVLVRRVKEFLDARRPIGADLAVLGPEYLAVDIDAEIAVVLESSPAETARECERRLRAFLHPVDGGPDGDGWAFGQQPHLSDFYPLLGGVDGVDYIRSLRIAFRENRPGLLETGDFLICSGNHKVRPCR
jgi:predicted phage baseplate assembly protein